jgi:hypothetical protein
VQAKLQDHLASTSNPFRHPEAQAKAQVRLKQIGYRMLNGGNGKAPPEPQRILAERLGWPMEWIVRTHARRGSGYPTHYKLDIASPSLGIAIEVDGHTHQAIKIREADDRKEAFLHAQGWLVLRFWNLEVLENLEEVERRIQSIIWKQVQGTTSSMASSSTTATNSNRRAVRLRAS